MKKRSHPLINTKFSLSHIRFSGSYSKDSKKPFEALKKKPDFRNNYLKT